MWTIRSRFTIAPAVPALVALLVAGCGGGSGDSSSAAPAPAAADLVARGKYLVTTSGCGDCHTPLRFGANGPEPDATRLLSGHPADVVVPPATLPDGWVMLTAMPGTAFLGPWGLSYAANLTPDATGLGHLTEDMFLKIFRTRQHFGSGRPILLPMPYAYSEMTDDDLKAMWHYLRSIPPVQNTVPDPVPAAAPAAAPSE